MQTHLNKRITLVTLIFTLALLSGCATSHFDSAFGMNDLWAAEKNLIKVFEAEGFYNGLSNTNRRSRDGAVVFYTYAPASGDLAYYTLSAAQNSPGSAALLSIAGKISPDRRSAFNEALKEFNTSRKPVLKQLGDFSQRGDFKVRVDEQTIELDNLWRAKRGP
jgi:outer membrane biogenesis lipoprotein LolB